MNESVKVLLIDDEEDFRHLMEFWLKSKGYSVLHADSGKSAIKIVKEKSPDIAFLDLHMPGMDGIETYNEIRKFNKDLPIIVISAYLEDPKLKGAVLSGISGVFPKDDDFEKGLSLLESVLRRHKKI